MNVAFMHHTKPFATGLILSVSYLPNTFSALGLGQSCFQYYAIQCLTVYGQASHWSFSWYFFDIYELEIWNGRRKKKQNESGMAFEVAEMDEQSLMMSELQWAIWIAMYWWVMAIFCIPRAKKKIIRCGQNDSGGKNLIFMVAPKMWPWICWSAAVWPQQPCTTTTTKPKWRRKLQTESVGLLLVVNNTMVRPFFCLRFVKYHWAVNVVQLHNSTSAYSTLFLFLPYHCLVRFRIFWLVLILVDIMVMLCSNLWLQQL